MGIFWAGRGVKISNISLEDLIFLLFSSFLKGLGVNEPLEQTTVLTFSSNHKEKYNILDILVVHFNEISLFFFYQTRHALDIIGIISTGIDVLDTKFWVEKYCDSK